MSTTRAPIENAYVVPGSGLVAGEYPAVHPDRTGEGTAEKLGRLLEAGVTVFVDLTAPADGMTPYEPVLRRLATTRGVAVDVHTVPIRDMHVCDPDHMRRVLDVLDVALAEGRVAYVHCWGGVGRTGMVVGCHLVRHGLDGDAALEEVARLFATMSPAKRRRHPGGSPQTRAQRAMVLGWAAHESAAPARRARIRGCLLGGAVGDALGWPVEFLSIAEIRARFGLEGITEFAEALGGIGAITDDTQMTLFTAEGLLWAMVRGNTRGICSVPAVVRHAYLRWYATQGGRIADDSRPYVLDTPSWLFAEQRLHARRAPGNSCLSALGSGRVGTVADPINDSKGCGGVMRMAPVGLLRDWEPFGLGVELAALTHGHSSGYLPAGALALMVSRLLGGATMEGAVLEALERLERAPRHDETSRALRAALIAARQGGVPSPAVVASLGAGWTGEEALAIAVYCALAADGDFARGVRLAVNHSGDSDSTGAIAGNLLGAMLGEEAIPERWRCGLELADVIGAMADDLIVGWREGDRWWDRYPGV